MATLRVPILCLCFLLIAHEAMAAPPCRKKHALKRRTIKPRQPTPARSPPYPVVPAKPEPPPPSPKPPAAAKPPKSRRKPPVRKPPVSAPPYGETPLPPPSPEPPAVPIPIPPTSPPSAFWPPKAPYTPPANSCPVSVAKLGVCAPALLAGVLGNPLHSDCCALLGVVGLHVEVCLCAAIDADVLGIGVVSIGKLEIIASICGACGQEVSADVSCP